MKVVKYSKRVRQYHVFSLFPFFISFFNFRWWRQQPRWRHSSCMQLKHRGLKEDCSFSVLNIRSIVSWGSAFFTLILNELLNWSLSDLRSWSVRSGVFCWPGSCSCIDANNVCVCCEESLFITYFITLFIHFFIKHATLPVIARLGLPMTVFGAQAPSLMHIWSVW